MKLYLTNLIQRLKEFSANLDKIELFVDVPWVIVDDDLNQQKYIFKRDGRIIMSLNGQVSIGKWELLSAARSILIDRIQDKILLNQNFIDPAVMILKKDGFKDENLILANEILIPDLNVTEYLKQLYYQKNRIELKRLKNGDLLEIHNYKNELSNNKVSFEDDRVPDGIYELEDSDKKFIVNNGQIVKIYNNYPFETNKGIILVEKEYNPTSLYLSNNQIGNFVFQNNLPAPDGKYRLAFMEHIWVENGRIIKTSIF